ncbi:MULTISPECIES: hypothetical protein [Gelidibacter]|uniref:NlpC/P60 family protein n=1 Tax=Gelidibacter pelagius TaxID=2819985 RepID=A0ABS3SX28_9FLAO|nr:MULTISPECIES: hypothetical protein [Gelidibacter]MBO3100256.1 hypothetical protein [Gelidibacter pelagius]
MDIEIQKAIEKVRIVDSDRSYWFIRTYGGEMFEDFITNSYVGVGLNSVPFKYLEEYKKDSAESFERIKMYIEKNTDYKDGSATNWTNQLINFHHEIRRGDLVVIPNKNSSYFHIGTVESDIYVADDNRSFLHKDKYEKFPEKRRKVAWEKRISASDVRNDLKGMTSTHQAITNINRFSEGIEGHISSIFIKEDKIYLVIKVNQDEDINAFDLSTFLSGITYFYKEFSKEEGSESEDLTIKIKLQSKGRTVLKGLAYTGVLGIAGLVLLSNNGEFKATIGEDEFSFKTDGLLNSMSDFLDKKQERKIKYEEFQQSIQNLKAKVSDEDNLNDNLSNEIKENREENNGENNSKQDENPN